MYKKVEYQNEEIGKFGVWILLPNSNVFYIPTSPYFHFCIYQLTSIEVFGRHFRDYTDPNKSPKWSHKNFETGELPSRLN